MQKSHRQVLRNLLALALVVTVHASLVAAENDVDSVVLAEGFYEYTKDGSSTLGMIIKRLTDGKVVFMTCNFTPVHVIEKDLRASKAKCDPRPPGKGNWNANIDSTTPVYAYGKSAVGTQVVVEGKVIDVKTLKGWSPTEMNLGFMKKSEPVGFVYRESNGSKALVLWVDPKSQSPERNKQITGPG